MAENGSASADETTRQTRGVWCISKSIWFPRPTALQVLRSFTLWLVVAQVALLTSILSSQGIVPFLDNPAAGPSYCALIRAGGMFTPLVIHQGQYWRILTANFLHSGLITLIMSIVIETLMILPVEIDFGTHVAVFVFLLTGATGYSFSCIANPLGISTGALTPLLGFAGFRLALGIIEWSSEEPECKRIGLLEIGTFCITVLSGQGVFFVDSKGAYVAMVQGCFIGSAFFAWKLEAPPHYQMLISVVGALTVGFVMYICGYALAATRSPAIDDIVWKVTCLDPSDMLDFRGLNQTFP